MPKMFNSIERNHVQSPELLKLIDKANQLTDGDGYKLYDDNAESLERVLDKILVLAKQEKEWYCYFIVLYEMLYLLDRSEKHMKVLKYAEIFYRDSKLYFDLAVSNHPGTGLGNYATWSYGMIYSTYKKFPQITDEKMQTFMESFRKTALQYGDPKEYFHDMLKLALVYRDKEMAKQNKEGLEQYEIKSCYLCAVRPILGYYLLCEDYEALEQMIKEIRTRTIPMQHRWCYRHCHLAKDKELISAVLDYCTLLGRSAYFHKLLKENAELFRIKDGDWDTSIACYHACVGDWTYLEEHIEQAEEDVKDWKHGRQSATGHLYNCLCWYCYFVLLDRQGTHAVRIGLEGNEVPQLENGNCSCLELAAYFEQEADTIGAQMEASRKKFDYGAIKKSYFACMKITKKI